MAQAEIHDAEPNAADCSGANRESEASGTYVAKPLWPMCRCADADSISGTYVADSHTNPRTKNCGDDGDRTHDLRLAKPALYQLSYIPKEIQSNGITTTRGGHDGSCGPPGDPRATVPARRQPSREGSLLPPPRVLRPSKKS